MAQMIQLHQLMQVHAVDWPNTDKIDCPICLLPLRHELTALDCEQWDEEDDGIAGFDQEYNNNEAIWRHGGCKIFHARCLQFWLAGSCSCPICRDCLKTASHEGPSAEWRLDPDIELMLMRRQHDWEEIWEEYWLRRDAQREKLGVEEYFQQPGYQAQEGYRRTVELARCILFSNYTDAIRYDDHDKNEDEGIDTSDNENSSAGEEQRRLVELFQRCNLLTAYHATEEAASLDPGKGWEERTHVFEGVVRDARSKLVQARRDDPKKHKWMADPPHSFRERLVNTGGKVPAGGD